MNRDEADRALDRLLNTMLTREEIDARLAEMDRDIIEQDEYVGRRIREHEARGDTSYDVGTFYEEWDTRARYTGGPLPPPHRLDSPLDCPRCGSVNVHYIGDLWQCNGCGEVFPDADLASPVPPCPRCSSTGGEALTFEYQALLGGRYYCPDCGAAYGKRLRER